MINNEFHVIGICTSDFNKYASKKFTCYSLHIEVERFGGSVFEVEVLIYSTNRSVDVSKSMLGKQVAVNGFVDTYKMDDGSFKIKLVAQNIMELSKTTKIIETAKAEVKTSPSIDVDDDDLPF